jgi:hypothetical protein
MSALRCEETTLIRLDEDAKERIRRSYYLDRKSMQGRIVEFVGDSYRYRHRLQQDILVEV